MIKGDSKMIKEKYTPLLLSHQMGGITTIGVTYKLAKIVQNNLGKRWKQYLRIV